ncbi:MAG: ribose 5-phosphate isomerase B [Desulfovibrionales bacterium]|nr:ribose 5-phosphate isomerase B [Desulfovibrionales bacterium]
MSVLFLGSDHAGLGLKQILGQYLAARFTIHDVGTHSEDSCDYPLIADALCTQVRQTAGLGILICGSGLGMSMAANRHAGIRAALCANEYMARMSRLHNNANVLCLGERILGVDLAKAIVDAFVETSFEGGRHERRVGLIDTQPSLATR